MTLTREQVREIDRRAVASGIPILQLMENAGKACAELLMRLNAEKQPTVVFCGPGNNGGDGYVMIRHLRDAGWPVRWAGLDPVSPDAIINAQRVIDVVLDPAPLPTTGWAVDALFGVGISRPLENRAAKLVNAINRYPNVLAIDIPSGLDCDTGEPLGLTVRATHTATFIAPKQAFVTPTGTAIAGEIHVLDIGVPREILDMI